MHSGPQIGPKVLRSEPRSGCPIYDIVHVALVITQKVVVTSQVVPPKKRGVNLIPEYSYSQSKLRQTNTRVE